MSEKRKKLIKIIVASSIFGALSIVLYCVPFFQFSLPFAPPFLKMHFDEIPIFIAGFAYGPTSAFIIIILKGLVKLSQDIAETGGIGVVADVIYSIVFIIPACLFYKYNRSFKGAIISILIGIVTQLLFSSVIGLYTIYPLYGFYFNPQATNYDQAMETIGTLFGAIDNSISTAKDPKIIYEFLLPFNIIKNLIVVSFVLFVYKPIRIFIEKTNKKS